MNFDVAIKSHSEKAGAEKTIEREVNQQMLDTKNEQE